MPAKRKKSANPKKSKFRQRSPKINELLYKTLIDNIHLGITLIDTNYRIVTTNAGQGKLFRKPHNKLVGKYCFREFEKRSKVCSHCPGTRSMATGRPAEVQTEGVRDDGSRASAHLRTFPVFESDGSISGFIEIVENITEYKHAEESLKESEERFKAIFDNAADGIALADVENKKFYIANKVFRQMLGYRPEEIKNLAVSDIHPKEHLPYVIKQFEKQARKELTLAVNIPVRRKDGSVFYADINSFPIILDGKAFLMGIFRDITERKRAEESLKESEERFKAIFDNIADGIILTEEKSKKFYLGNKAICKMLGYKPEEIKKLTVLDIHPKERLPFILKQFARQVAREITVDEGVPVKRKNGSIFYADISAFPITFGGKTYIAGVFRDVTAHKKAEESLRTSEAQLSNAMKIAKLGYWEYDVAEDMFTFNDQFYSIYRTSAEKVGGYRMSSEQYARKFLHPDDVWIVKAEIKKSIETTDPHFSRRLEHRIIYADGEVGYITVRHFVVKDKQGRTVKTFGANQDITDYKKVEEELRQAQAKYKTLVEQIPAVTYTTALDKSSITPYISPQILKLVGFSPEECVADPDLWRKLLHPEDRQRVLDELYQSQKNKHPFNCEYRLFSKDGSVVWCRDEAVIVYDDYGKPLMLQGVMFDITMQKRAEEELQQAEAKYRALVEQIPAVTYTAALDKASTTTYVSPQILKFIGFSQEEYKADLDIWQKQLHPEDRQRVLERLYQSQKSENPFLCEYRMLSKDRKVVWCRDEAAIVKDISGKPLMLQGVMFDISAQKLAEEELNIYREKMAKAERLASLGTLSATVAHELTQPLTVIRLSLENSLEDLEPTSCCNTVKDALKDALNEVINATSVVDRFRNYARQSSKKTICETNLGAVAGRVAQLLSKTAQHAKMTLSLKGLDNLPPVYSNEKDIEQLFFALTENAIQATNGKRNFRLTVSGVVKGNNIELQFADNCCGIAPENLDKIFDPFFTTGSNDGRTGLGLPIVQRILSEHGGKIRVQSRPGKGTTFYVTLPIRPEITK
jgi:PAS domain S-box-containing protein